MRNIIKIYCYGKFSGLTLSMLILACVVSANVKPNSLFSDHMILQMGKYIPIWGTAQEGEKITVNFNGQEKKTIAVNGRWRVKLSPMPYTTTPLSMTVSGNDTVIVHDILVGEVWLCSGQSNMERQLGPTPSQLLITNWEKEKNEANYPLIRQFFVPLKYSTEKITDVNGNWTICSPQMVVNFSAVGFFFARNLYQRLKVPIGIIFSAYGGTIAEDWTSKTALENNTELNEFTRNYKQITSQSWHPKEQVMNGLYNGMIYPLIPFAIKGVAWYQGENNNVRAGQYRTVLSTMIQNWRKDFQQGNFPFLIVQIAPHKDMKPELREAQFLVSQTVKNIALIVTTDCGHVTDIHPPYKQPVGERLALSALHLAYKVNIEYEGPLYKSHKIRNSSIILNFNHIGKGLSIKGSDELKGFVIAGKNTEFVQATAKIKGKQIIVYNNQIKKPIAARYGWANAPNVNLINLEGLPASPFRTDVKSQD